MKQTDRQLESNHPVSTAALAHLDGIPVVKVGAERAQQNKTRFIPPIPFDWDRGAVAAGANAARIRTLVAYRYRTTKQEWFTVPKMLLDSYGIDARARRRGLHELADAGLIEVRSLGAGRPTQLRVLGWQPRE
jgi:hypothetical protein